MTSPETACPESDDDLLACYRGKREPEDFALIVRRHAGMVLRTCQRITGNRHDAEDSAQATFLILAQRPEVVTRTLVGWLHKVAHDCAAQVLRSRARRQRREEAMARMKPPVSTEPANELREELDAALLRLPDSLRQAVVLHYLEGYPHEEAARIAGCTPGAFRLRSMKGLQRLRGILGRREGVCTLSALTALLAHEAQASAAVTPLLLWNLAGTACSFSGAATATPAAEIAHSVLQNMLWSRRRFLGGAALLFLGAGTSLVWRALAANPATPSVPSLPALSALDVQIAATLPRPEEERWLQIPWRTDLAAARVEADRAGKPLFLWLMDGHPLGMACDNAVWGRMHVFSEPRVIATLQNDYVAVAAQTHHLAHQEPALRGRNDTQRWLEGIIAASGMRKIHPTATAQGCYAFTAEGRLLAAECGQNHVPRMLEEAARKLAAEPVAKNRAVIKQAQLGPACELPGGAAVLRIYSRIHPLPSEPGLDLSNTFVGRDFLWILREEQQEIARRLSCSALANLPEPLAWRIVRYHLADGVRGVPLPHWQRQHVQKCDFRIRRASGDATALRVELTGQFAVDMPETPVRYGKRPAKMKLAGTLEGILELDRSQRLTAARLFAQAEACGSTPFAELGPKGPYPLKFAMVLADDPLTREVPPQGRTHGQREYFHADRI